MQIYIIRFTCVLEDDGSHAQMSRQRVLFTKCSLGQNSLNSCESNGNDNSMFDIYYTTQMSLFVMYLTVSLHYLIYYY